MYSLIETAKANGLRVYEYLEYVLTELAAHQDDASRDFLADLILWSKAAQKNADVLAHWLENHPKITKVFYPGLADFPGRDIHFKQSRGAGAMLSLYTDSHETALKVLKNVKLIRFAESLGGVESLITYPATQTHSDLTEEERQSRGITACLLRLSVGIEDVNDLIADLEQALG